eukprot:3958138-Alexandrium_andersonii.AAC.1
MPVPAQVHTRQAAAYVHVRGDAYVRGVAEDVLGRQAALWQATRAPLCAMKDFVEPVEHVL